MARIGSPRPDQSSLTRLELTLRVAVSSKYNGVLPVKMNLVEDRTSPMSNCFYIEVGVPGQVRRIPISVKQLQSLNDADTVDEVKDEVLFAIFLLLDEDDEDI